MALLKLLTTIFVFSTLISCSSMSSTKEELRNMSGDEGIVYGSILLTVKEHREENVEWTLFNYESKDTNWVLTIVEDSYNPITSLVYTLDVKPETEKIFIKKLPTGTYRITSLKPSYGFKNKYSLKLNILFKVNPSEVTYIGKLTGELPYQYTDGNFVKFNMSDDKVMTSLKIKDKYSSIIKNSTKAIAIIGANR